MNGWKISGRLLAAVLSLVMVLGMIPVIPMTVIAADNDKQNRASSEYPADAVGRTSHMDDYVFDSLHAYAGGKLDKTGELIEGTVTPVTFDKDKLFSIVNTATNRSARTHHGIELSREAKIVLSSASGDTTGAGLNPNAVLNDDQSITYTATQTGSDVFYYVIVDDYDDHKNEYEDKYGPITVTVYTYGVADSVFVLDYNLPVELNDGKDSFFNNDVLSLGDKNPYGTTCTFLGCENPTSKYGDFTVNGESVRYTMREFMNGADTIEIEVQVLETNAKKLNQYTGVKMTQTVTVVPANVMYYEDDFTGNGAITYVNTGSATNGNIWAVYEGEEKGTVQSPDQTLNYGSDPNYAENKTNVYGDLSLSRLEGSTDSTLLNAVGKDIFKTAYGYDPEEGMTSVLYGDASNDTIHTVSIHNAANAAIMSFDFYGTGFEIVGRTTVGAYGVLTAQIQKIDPKTGKATYVAAIPVITECVSGDLTQVPYIVRKDMEQGYYRVTVYTSNVKGENRMVYVDGVRIYQPLSAEDAATYYKANESAATFHEIKTEIVNGNIVYGQITGRLEEVTNLWAFGSTMIENYTLTGSFTLYPTSDENSTIYDEEYMTYGPNNEIYLRNDWAENAFTYIAFYVEIDESYEGERSIQIGAHLKGTWDNAGLDDTSVAMAFGGSAEDLSKNLYSVASGTEQYFSVDSSLVFMHPNGPDNALVVIGTRDTNMNVLALTNLKLNGYKLADNMVDEILAVQDMYDVGACVLMRETAAISQALADSNDGE